ncbi:hypothetical protein K7X08_020995 [Anisodus acutangulus]|uniref:Uncharacterized protein n=1 Tax=Anisodus acutangulus TaxID=402998 RepID=A0A9Q1RMY9_9SOLA|nr:hypothetical protein K7X08_020995 [Anisodus acutangulus]
MNRRGQTNKRSPDRTYPNINYHVKRFMPYVLSSEKIDEEATAVVEKVVIANQEDNTQNTDKVDEEIIVNNDQSDEKVVEDTSANNDMEINLSNNGDKGVGEKSVGTNLVVYTNSNVPQGVEENVVDEEHAIDFIFRVNKTGEYSTHACY